MKKLLLIIGLFFTAQFCWSQKMDKPKIDKIEGDTIFQTKEELISNKGLLTPKILFSRVSKIKGIYTIQFRSQESIAMFYVINPGDEADIKLTGGKVIRLKAAFGSQSTLLHSDYGSLTEGYATYLLSNEDIKDLQSDNAAVVRLITSKAPLDYDIKDSKSDMIKKQLALFSSKN